MIHPSEIKRIAGNLCTTANICCIIARLIARRARVVKKHLHSVNPIVMIRAVWGRSLSNHSLNTTVAQLVRALPWHGRGRWFESTRLYQIWQCYSYIPTTLNNVLHQIPAVKQSQYFLMLCSKHYCPSYHLCLPRTNKNWHLRHLFWQNTSSNLWVWSIC